MQNKTIRKTLKRKIDSWLETIKDEELRTRIKKDVIVTGGSIASMLLKEEVNDYDIYFRTKETAKDVAEYYCQKFGELNPTKSVPKVSEESIENIKGVSEDRIILFVTSSGVVGEDNDVVDSDDDVEEEISNQQQISEDESTSKEKYRPVFLSNNSITLSNKVQLIIRFYGEPDEIHNNFDFIHACNWYSYKGNHLEIKKEALESLLQRRLVYAGSLYPICSMFRAKKFMKRGWECGVSEILKMCFQISKIDMTSIQVLTDQLTGVDALYMYNLIEALHENSDDIGDTDYITNLIDEMWNK